MKDLFGNITPQPSSDQVRSFSPLAQKSVKKEDNKKKGGMNRYESLGLDTVKKSKEEGKAGYGFCPFCQDTKVISGFSFCFANSRDLQGLHSGWP